MIPLPPPIGAIWRWTARPAGGARDARATTTHQKFAVSPRTARQPCHPPDGRPCSPNACLLATISSRGAGARALQTAAAVPMPAEEPDAQAHTPIALVTPRPGPGRPRVPVMLAAFALLAAAGCDSRAVPLPDAPRRARLGSPARRCGLDGRGDGRRLPSRPHAADPGRILPSLRRGQGLPALRLPAHRRDRRVRRAARPLLRSQGARLPGAGLLLRSLGRHGPPDLHRHHGPVHPAQEQAPARPAADQPDQRHGRATRHPGDQGRVLLHRRPLLRGADRRQGPLRGRRLEHLSAAARQVHPTQARDLRGGGLAVRRRASPRAGRLLHRLGGVPRRRIRSRALRASPARPARRPRPTAAPA